MEMLGCYCFSIFQLNTLFLSKMIKTFLFSNYFLAVTFRLGFWLEVAGELCFGNGRFWPARLWFHVDSG